MRHRLKKIMLTTALGAALAVPAAGAEMDMSEAFELVQAGRSVRLSEITVSATRSAESIDAFPGRSLSYRARNSRSSSR